MEKLDILNRTHFVERIIKLLENLSDNKTTTCFAIDGEWGTGKSFVLDMLEEQINGPYSERYFAVRYNCWKYDYYEEPLIAIVSSLVAEIETKVSIFPESEEKQEILGMLKAVGVSLLSLANTAFKAKTGLDIQSAYEVVIKGEKEGAAKYEKEHEYDTYLGLNKIIHKLSRLLQDIANDHTIIIIVDELDRCLPQYAIKVLERLHHLTENKSNIITIIATDKKQLECSIRHLFGFEETSKYLEKFINFEIMLDNGSVSHKITEKYADYIALFDKELIPFAEPIEEYFQAIFKDIGARKQEQIMRKVMLTHKLLFADKKDYSFMCVELLTAVMMEVYNYTKLFSKQTQLHFSSFGDIFTPYGDSPKPAFTEFFKKKLNNVKFIRSLGTGGESIIYRLPDEIDLYASILFTWYHMHNKNDNAIKDGVFVQSPIGCGYEPMKDYPEDLNKFAETFRMIK